MTAPAVSVLMAVHNGAPYLQEALHSILRQTWPNFELLVVDDGSTDETPAILGACGDSRLAVHCNERNLGLVASLNRGLDLARGEFVARMDADDLSLPVRLERQVNFLRRSPGIGLCGTWFRTIGGARSILVRPPAGADDAAARLFHESPLAHPSAMFRRELFERHALRYSPDYPHAEDFELWTRVAQATGIANVPEVLLQYRQHEAQVSVRSDAIQRESVRRILLRQLERIHPSATDSERAAHVSIIANQSTGSPPTAQVSTWLQGLIRRNDSSAGFPPAAFRRVIAMIWWRHCSVRAAQAGVLTSFYSSPLTWMLPIKYQAGMLAVRAGFAGKKP